MQCEGSQPKRKTKPPGAVMADGRVEDRTEKRGSTGSCDHQESVIRLSIMWQWRTVVDLGAVGVMKYVAKGNGLVNIGNSSHVLGTCGRFRYNRQVERSFMDDFLVKIRNFRRIQRPIFVTAGMRGTRTGTPSDNSGSTVTLLVRTQTMRLMDTKAPSNVHNSAVVLHGGDGGNRILDVGVAMISGGNCIFQEQPAVSSDNIDPVLSANQGDLCSLCPVLKSPIKVKTFLGDRCDAFQAISRKMLLLNDKGRITHLSLLIVGSQSVGKSTLIEAFLSSYPQQLNNQQSTSPASAAPSLQSSASQTFGIPRKQSKPTMSEKSQQQQQQQLYTYGNPSSPSNPWLGPYAPTIENCCTIQYAFVDPNTVTAASPSNAQDPLSNSASAAPTSASGLSVSTTLPPSLPSSSDQTKPLSLTIIDVGGAREFASLLPSAIAAADAFMIVYDVGDKRTFESIFEYFRQIVLAKGAKPPFQSIPIIVVGNMVDTVAGGDLGPSSMDSPSRRLRQVTNQQGQGLANILKVPFVETTARAPHLVASTFRAVVAQAQAKAGEVMNSVAVPSVLPSGVPGIGGVGVFVPSTGAAYIDRTHLRRPSEASLDRFFSFPGGTNSDTMNGGSTASSSRRASDSSVDGALLGVLGTTGIRVNLGSDGTVISSSGTITLQHSRAGSGSSNQANGHGVSGGGGGGVVVTPGPSTRLPPAKFDGVRFRRDYVYRQWIEHQRANGMLPPPPPQVTKTPTQQHPKPSGNASTPSAHRSTNDPRPQPHQQPNPQRQPVLSSFPSYAPQRPSTPKYTPFSNPDHHPDSQRMRRLKSMDDLSLRHPTPPLFPPPSAPIPAVPTTTRPRIIDPPPRLSSRRGSDSSITLLKDATTLAGLQTLASLTTNSSSIKKLDALMEEAKTLTFSDDEEEEGEMPERTWTVTPGSFDYEDDDEESSDEDGGGGGSSTTTTEDGGGRGRGEGFYIGGSEEGSSSSDTVKEVRNKVRALALKRLTNILDGLEV
ncbi:hypothetical protein BJ742DRAFT_744390 [Cladochytrium replicatum]|nr:hypothetical protein BJ742DRAFT_744390 [Cladochytrium replicatum]